MEDNTLQALGGRDILPRKQYIVVRKLWGDVVVNVITAETRPAFDQDRQDSFFQASCQFVFERELSDSEGAAIELSFQDIGCDRNRPAQKVQARTFPFGEVEHVMLARAVKQAPEQWRQHLKNGHTHVHYTVTPATEHAEFQLQGRPGLTSLSSGLIF